MRPDCGDVDADDVVPVEAVVGDPPQQRVGRRFVLRRLDVVLGSLGPAAPDVVLVQGGEGDRREQQEAHTERDPECSQGEADGRLLAAPECDSGSRGGSQLHRRGDATVAHDDLAVGVRGNTRLVRDQHDGGAFAARRVDEEIHHELTRE